MVISGLSTDAGELSTSSVESCVLHENQGNPASLFRIGERYCPGNHPARHPALALHGSDLPFAEGDAAGDRRL